MNDFTFLDAPSSEVAPRLLGCEFERELDGRKLVARIVETEAYTDTDAASHSYKGRTPRTDVMFGPSGHLYVYFTYGMHYCMNVVTSGEGCGAGVLIRAVEPLAGVEIMSEHRGGKSGVELTNGPAKATQALAVNRQWNGHDLQKSPLRLIIRPPLAPEQIIQTTRVGISQAKDVPWRFFIRSNAYVSKSR